MLVNISNKIKDMEQKEVIGYWIKEKRTKTPLRVGHEKHKWETKTSGLLHSVSFLSCLFYSCGSIFIIHDFNLYLRVSLLNIT
jgi:hypothetical protein